MLPVFVTLTYMCFTADPLIVNRLATGEVVSIRLVNIPKTLHPIAVLDSELGSTRHQYSAPIRLDIAENIIGARTSLCNNKLYIATVSTSGFRGACPAKCVLQIVSAKDRFKIEPADLLNRFSSQSYSDKQPTGRATLQIDDAFRRVFGQEIYLSSKCPKIDLDIYCQLNMRMDRTPYIDNLSSNNVCYISIAAVGTDHAIISLYSQGSIGFIKIHFARSVEGKGFEGDNLEKPNINGDAGHYVFRIVPMGISKCHLSTWVNSFWVGERLHLLSDSGEYDCFRFIESRAEHVATLSLQGKPELICLDQKRLGVLFVDGDSGVSLSKLDFNLDELVWSAKVNMGTSSLHEALSVFLKSNSDKK